MEGGGGDLRKDMGTGREHGRSRNRERAEESVNEIQKVGCWGMKGVKGVIHTAGEPYSKQQSLIV